MVSRHFGGHSSAKPLQIDEGNGVPSHAADRATLYWDYTNKKLYINTGGATTWEEKSPGGGGDILPNYWNPQRGDPEIVLPSNYVSIRPVFGNGAWGGWYGIQASTAADYVLLVAQLSKVIVTTGSYWCQVGIGAAGSEAPIAEFGGHAFISGSGAYPVVTNTWRLEPRLIPAGSRVAARGWYTVGHSGASIMLSCITPAATWYSPWPNTYIAGARATKLWRSPAVAGWVAINANAGAYSTVIASAANDLLFNACEFSPLAAGGGQGNVLELAVGAAGAEQVLSRVPIGEAIVTSFCQGYSEAARKGIILTGERVSARLIAPGAAGPYNMAFYFEDI